MKRVDEQLSRLLRAAAAAREPEIDDPPPYLLRRIVARCRDGTIADAPCLVAALVFRRALVCAFIVMALTVAWAHRQLVEPMPNEVAIAEYETRMTLSP